MSRGGGRGGFRGGRGGGASGRPEAPMGMMTYQEVQGVAVKEGGKLYPVSSERREASTKLQPPMWFINTSLDDVIPWSSIELQSSLPTRCRQARTTYH